MWRASRPAPSAIWWRQLVPQAASSVVGRGGAHLRQARRARRSAATCRNARPRSRTTPAMPQQVEVEGLDREVRDQPQRVGARRRRCRTPSGGNGRAAARSCPASARAAARSGRPGARSRRIPRTAGRAPASALLAVARQQRRELVAQGQKAGRLEPDDRRARARPPARARRACAAPPPALRRPGRRRGRCGRSRAAARRRARAS